jgi:hypothetical protein
MPSPEMRWETGKACTQVRESGELSKFCEVELQSRGKCRSMCAEDGGMQAWLLAAKKNSRFACDLHPMNPTPPHPISALG